jgi:AcrR family transcriptional regulator
MIVKAEPPWRSRRRQKILAAAGQLFARAGYDGVQMDDIARAAGVGKPTLYRYFPSKDELFLTVFDATLARLEVELADTLAAGLAPPATLARMIAILIRALARQFGTLRLLAGERTPLAERWRTAFRRSRQPILDALREALARGMASGDFRRLDLAVAPAMVMGIVRGGHVGATEAGIDKLAEVTVDFIMQGIAGQAPGGRPRRRMARTG